MDSTKSKDSTNTNDVIASKPKRRRGVGKNSPVIGDNGIDMSPNESKTLAEYALDVYLNAADQAVNLDDPAEVHKAITDYFHDCSMRGLRPGNLGLYAWLGLSKQDVSDALRGKSKRLNPSTIDLIKKAKLALSSYREMLGSMGKINPVTLIFWQKNWDNLVDKQEIAIEPKQTFAEQKTMEEIAASVPELLDSDLED